jgi:hypothetical protein
VKRTRLKPVSDKRRATFPARKAAMAEVRARDSNTCQFWLRLVVWAQESGAVYFPNRPNVDGAALLRQCREAFPVHVPDCFGDLNGHEPRKQAHHSEDYTDPERIVLLCNVHNDWVEDYPIERKLLDL